MSSGGEAFLALSSEIPSPENEGFWQYILVSLTVFTGEEKRKWNMRKEARLDLTLALSLQPLVVYLCVFGRIECIVYRIIRHPYGPAMNGNCDNVSVKPEWKCKTLVDYSDCGADHTTGRNQVMPN